MKGGYQGYPAPQRVLPTTDDIRGVTAYASTTGDLIADPLCVDECRASRSHAQSEFVAWRALDPVGDCGQAQVAQASLLLHHPRPDKHRRARSRDLDLQRRADSHGSALGP